MNSGWQDSTPAVTVTPPEGGDGADDRTIVTVRGIATNDGFNSDRHSEVYQRNHVQQVVAEGSDGFTSDTALVEISDSGTLESGD